MKAVSSPEELLKPLGGTLKRTIAENCARTFTDAGGVSKKYTELGLHKALAVTIGDGRGYAGWNYESAAAVRADLLLRCERRYGVPCRIVDVDGVQCRGGGGAICYSDYVRNYPDLLAAYNATGGGQKIEDWGKAHYNSWGKSEGRVAPIGNCGGGGGGGCYGDYVRSYPDLLAAYNATGGGQKIEDWGKAHYNAAGKWEGRALPASCNGGGAIRGDYKYLYKHNAFKLSGRTTRWPSSLVTVSGSKYDSWRQIIQKWPAVNFRFVGSGGKIDIRYARSNDWCGIASWYGTYSGKITRCDIQINPAIELSGNRTCLDHRDTLQHEIGHCIGFFGHTTDGSLMDPRAGHNRGFTRPVRDMINLLYSMPPGTDIRPNLLTMMPIGDPGSDRFDPDSREVIRMDFVVWPKQK